MSTLDDILDDPWVQERRAAGGAIIVTGLSGRIHHADNGLAALVGRREVPTNAFDLIAAGHTLKASALVAKYLGRRVRTRFPLSNDAGGEGWFRFDVSWPSRMIVMAVWPEENQEHHAITAERI